MNILYLHTTIWHGFFASLLKEYATEHGARVGIVCPERFKHLYADAFAAGAVHYLAPDLEAEEGWEGDEAEVRRLERVAAQCERASGKALGRYLLAQERNLGAGYTLGSYYWPGAPLRNRCLADSAHPGRAALRAFRFMGEVFEAFKPGLVISRSFNPALDLAAWMLAARADVPMVCCRFSKAIGRRAFWTDDYHMYNTPGHELYAEYEQARREPSGFARGHLEEFRTRPRTVDYIAQNWARPSDWYTAHRSFLGLTKAKVLYRMRGSRGQQPLAVLPKVYEFYRRKAMEILHARHFRTFSDQELAGMRYAYYPLHKEPELMLNYESPLWHDQLHAVKFLSSMLPSGLRLLVREHRFNWGRRHGRYLRAMAAIPNVVLVDPFDPQFKYIGNAELVVTDNGSTGWEGIAMRRRVVTLEKNFYEVLPQANTVRDPRELDAALLAALDTDPGAAGPEYDTAICRFLDAEHATTLDIDEMHVDMSLSVARIAQLLDRRKTR